MTNPVHGLVGQILGNHTASAGKDLYKLEANLLILFARAFTIRTQPTEKPVKSILIQ
jgi:hypothetical protein